MIPRDELLFSLAMAQKGIRCEAPAKVMEELCRVYLAWVDAPEGWVGTVRQGQLSQVVVHLLAPQQIEWADGKRVKMLEVPDE